MEYSERIKKIDALFESMLDLGVSSMSVGSFGGRRGYAYLDHDGCGDLRSAKLEYTQSGHCVIRSARSPGALDLILVQGMEDERVYRKTWGLDDGNQ